MMIRQPVIRWLPATTLNRCGTTEVALIANRLMPIPTLGNSPSMRRTRNIMLHPSQFDKYRSILLDMLLAILFVSCAMGIAHWKQQYPDQLTWLEQDARSHLGAEYNQIAIAIYNGQGFSNPFRVQTGPTSWMPPVLPYLMASLYWVGGGSENFVTRCMLLANAFAVTVSSWIVLREARKLGMVVVGYVVLIGGLMANFHQLFQSTSDTALLLFVVNLLWLGTVKLRVPACRFSFAIAWGLFGGICALCSPVVGAVWAVLTLIKLLPHKATLAQFAVAATISILIVAPWTIRNRVVLGAWVPIKSNGMYELWQSQCVDNEGVLDSRTLFDQPFSGYSTQRKRYQELGEIAFIEEKGAIAKKSIYENPREFATRIANRWSAACLFYTPMKSVDEHPGGGWPIFWKRIVFPLPVISLLIVLILRAVPFEPELWSAASIWFFALLPYIVISYYDRYATPLVGMKMLIVIFGLHTLVSSDFVSRLGKARHCAVNFRG